MSEGVHTTYCMTLLPKNFWVMNVHSIVHVCVFIITLYKHAEISALAW